MATGESVARTNCVVRIHDILPTIMIEFEDSRTRFSNRVSDYVHFRPGYPGSAVDYIVSAAKADRSLTIADIGSGTGMLAHEFLKRHAIVCAVEPNPDMRKEADEALSAFENYRSVAGEAAKTGLSDASVDLITAGQAFHWFAVQAAATEFERILRPGGLIALVWNDRWIEENEFHVSYDQLLRRWCPEYTLTSHKSQSEESILALFPGFGIATASFPNKQIFDLFGLKGRVQSSSYCPVGGDPNHTGLMEGLETLFDKWQRDGTIEFCYTTKVYMLRREVTG